jgi:hypothetical protein
MRGFGVRSPCPSVAARHPGVSRDRGEAILENIN